MKNLTYKESSIAQIIIIATVIVLLLSIIVSSFKTSLVKHYDKMPSMGLTSDEIIFQEDDELCLK